MEIVNSHEKRRVNKGPTDQWGLRRFPAKKRRKIREKLLDIYGNVCFRCGSSRKPEDLTIDHVIPVSAGGTNDFKNLRVMCNRCNQEKGGYYGP